MFSALYMECEKNMLEFYWITKGNMSGGAILTQCYLVSEKCEILLFFHKKNSLKVKNTVYLWKVYNFVQPQSLSHETVLAVACHQWQQPACRGINPVRASGGTDCYALQVSVWPYCSYGENWKVIVSLLSINWDQSYLLGWDMLPLNPHFGFLSCFSNLLQSYISIKTFPFFLLIFVKWKVSLMMFFWIQKLLI